MTDEAVFLHSMFRTGSTYLAARFAADPRYLMFYEPFHGGLASRRGIARSQRGYAASRAGLGHDPIDGGYWAAYLDVDPMTGRTPRALYRARFAVHDVLNGASPAGVSYLRACQRTAAAKGRAAMFGFCRSGLQVAGLAEALPGRHLHLFRDPRRQFASFEAAGRDYFLPQTLLQLLASRPLAAAALEVGGLAAPLAPLVRAASRTLPPAATARLGRGLARGLAPEARYGLFYLAWLACGAHGRAHARFSFALAEAEAPARRRRIEEELGLRLEGLRAIDGAAPGPGFAAGPVEARVERLAPAL